jgi:hypothetical protein
MSGGRRHDGGRGRGRPANIMGGLAFVAECRAGSFGALAMRMPAE